MDSDLERRVRADLDAERQRVALLERLQRRLHDRVRLRVVGVPILKENEQRDQCEHLLIRRPGTRHFHFARVTATPPRTFQRGSSDASVYATPAFIVAKSAGAMRT